MTEPAYVEIGKRYSYAGALEWPGWCRHAKAGGDAVAALAAYGARCRDALALSGITFDPPADASGLEVVERHEGNSGTEYGVPSVVPEADRRAFDEASVARLVAILQACWSAFDKAAQDAIGHELRKGPRGGGRDLDGTIEHLIESDVAYLSKLGARNPGSRMVTASSCSLPCVREPLAPSEPVRWASRSRSQAVPGSCGRRDSMSAMPPGMHCITPGRSRTAWWFASYA